jgi:hypothetical protein
MLSDDPQSLSGDPKEMLCDLHDQSDLAAMRRAVI